jgi:hypothetical protein
MTERFLALALAVASFHASAQSPTMPLSSADNIQLCQFNKETRQYFDLKSYAPEKRLEAYKQYLEDLAQGKYESRPCPPSQ